jgi:hypothetical protein
MNWCIWWSQICFQARILVCYIGINWTLFDAFHYLHAQESLESIVWNYLSSTGHCTLSATEMWYFPVILDLLLYSIMNFWVSQCLIFGLRNDEATLASCNFVLFDATFMNPLEVNFIMYKSCYFTQKFNTIYLMLEITPEISKQVPIFFIHCF